MTLALFFGAFLSLFRFIQGDTMTEIVITFVISFLVMLFSFYIYGDDEKKGF